MTYETEQPNQNQSSFGPSNQSSTFSQPNQNQNQGAPGVNNQAMSFSSPFNNNSFGSPDTQINQPPQNQGTGWGAQPPSASTGALPWQANNTQPSVSNPSWNVGHDGTQGGMNREQYRDSWMSSGVSNNQAMDQWLAQNGGQRLNDSGVVRTPYGEILDMGMAFKTGSGKPAWTDIGMNNAGQSPIFQPSPAQMGPSASPNQQGQMPGGYQLQPYAAQTGMNINPPGMPPGQFPGPQLNPTSNYNFGPSQGQNGQMDISSLINGNKPGMQQPGVGRPVMGNQGQSPFGPTGSSGGIRNPNVDWNNAPQSQVTPEMVRSFTEQNPGMSTGNRLGGLGRLFGGQSIYDQNGRFQQSPEMIQRQDERNMKNGAPGPGYVSNGWGGWMTRERAEQMRQSGAMS